MRVTHVCLFVFNFAERHVLLLLSSSQLLLWDFAVPDTFALVFMFMTTRGFVSVSEGYDYGDIKEEVTIYDRPGRTKK